LRFCQTPSAIALRGFVVIDFRFWLVEAAQKEKVDENGSRQRRPGTCPY
jgi:hypothetical protein